jgi:hypothetical protein
MKKNSLLLAVMSFVCISSQAYSDQKHSITTGSHPASQDMGTATNRRT